MKRWSLEEVEVVGGVQVSVLDDGAGVSSHTTAAALLHREAAAPRVTSEVVIVTTTCPKLVGRVVESAPREVV